MKRTIAGKIMAVILSVAFAVTSVDVAALADETESGGISNPIMVPVQTPLKAGQKVTYDCVYFGSYPQAELVKSGSDEEAALITMNKNFTTEYKVLSDADFSVVSSADYDSNGDATVFLSDGGVKVRRAIGNDATRNEGLDGCYEWPDLDSYHYFLYEPIKWRVLSVDGNNALLLADKCLDDQKYHKSISITWENSDIRSWLNDKFYNAAFSDDEKTAIISSSIENKNNLSYDTAGGNNTTDNIFLLSESEVYSTDAAASYGFAKSADTYDEARRTQPSAYAFAMGCYRDVESNIADNCMWWLRSPGGSADYVATVASNGYVFSYICRADNVFNAVRPALKLNLSSITVSYAGTVCTNGTVDEAASMGASGISSPRIVDLTSVPTMEAGQKVTYDCVYFGSYPQTEFVKSGSAEETALVTMNEKFTTEYKVLTSTDFALVSGATYDENGEARVTLSTGGAVKVRRIKKDDATCSTTDTEYYQWPDSTSYQYFLYEPIKWRVLSVDGNNALLLADKCLDDQQYHRTYGEITWENSDIRGWLNGTFYNLAFSGNEKTAIKITNVENKDNLHYNAEGGNDTTDKVFLLSESEVYSTDSAVSYGFVKSGDAEDEARRAQASSYAFAMGSYRTTSTNYAGNCNWWLRSPGSYSDNAAYVDCYGYVYDCGYSVNHYDEAVRPALNLNLASGTAIYAGTVCTDGTVTGHTHSYETIESVDVSCTEDGYVIKKCTNPKCKYETKEITDTSTGHGNSVKDSKNSYAATCTKAGIDVYVCDVCGDELERNDLDAKGHTKVKDTENSYAATCTKAGIDVYVCDVCGDELERKDIDAKGHGDKVKDAKNSYAATCTKAGIEVYVCSICGETLETKDLPASQHDWESDYTTDTPATCDVDGKKSIHCKNCDAKKDETSIPATGHTYGEWKLTIVPTAGKEGERQRVCTCGHIEKEAIAALAEDESFVEFNDNKPVVYTGYKMTPVVEVYHDGKLLTPEVDYTIKFSGNQNASTDKSTGKYTITYKGEYKSLKKETRTFEMAKANVEDTTIVCTDLATYAKPGVFKAKVYVDLNGYTLKASDYAIAYYLDEECTIPMDSKHKLEIAEGEAFATAYVKVTGKDKNLTGSKVASFKVYKKPAKTDSVIDISKCKLVLDASAKKGLTYDGEAKEPAVTVMNGKTAVADGFDVEYVGNIQKGTATIIVKGDGEKAVGSKVVSFKIK